MLTVYGNALVLFYNVGGFVRALSDKFAQSPDGSAAVKNFTTFFDDEI